MDLRICPLFADLSPRELASLQPLAHAATIEAGSVVFRDLDPGDSLVVIQSGTVRVSRQSPAGDDEELAQLSSGSHFGEMALVGDRRRSATCTALERCEIATIPFAGLEPLLGSDPALSAKLYRAIAASLARRIQNANSNLAFLKGFLKAKG